MRAAGQIRLAAVGNMEVLFEKHLRVRACRCFFAAYIISEVCKNIVRQGTLFPNSNKILWVVIIQAYC